MVIEMEEVEGWNMERLGFFFLYSILFIYISLDFLHVTVSSFFVIFFVTKTHACFVYFTYSIFFTPPP